VSFREKEREVKKLKEDIERLKKQHADAMQQLQDATEEQLKLK
jgi:predicted  nucleic acid-binding Zn-ribbon protein